MTGKTPVRSVARRSFSYKTRKVMVLSFMVGAWFGTFWLIAVGVGLVECVGRTCWRYNFIWPFAGARAFGRCFVMSSAVKPGQDKPSLC